MTKSTLPKVSRKLPHDPSNGRFEPAGPLNDPALRREMVGSVQAIDRLTPFLLGLAHGAGPDSPASRLMLNGVGALVLVRESITAALLVDSERGNGSSAEVDVQRLVSSIQTEWSKLFAGLSPPAGLALTGIDKGSP